ALAAGHGGRHLAAAELLGEEDRRLLPALGCDHDDGVDPVGAFEALQALGEEWPPVQRREGFGTVPAEPLATAGCDEDRPGTQVRTALDRCADLRLDRAL